MDLGVTNKPMIENKLNKPYRLWLALYAYFQHLGQHSTAFEVKYIHTLGKQILLM